MVAYTDAAGKYSIDAPRNGNEDNFYFAYDLSKNAPSKGESDVDTQLSDCGLLMVVADGMGGQNAGEVASQIAVDTVAEFFSPGKVSPQLACDHQKRKKYMEHVISEADIRIKKDSKHETGHKGMGSTIIMAWIVRDELTLSWCGDSRAYRFNPASGIELLSKDHSYVQELVDKNLIRYEDTFDHPQGNIVTRSLGDVSKKAISETKLFKVYNNDIILLCSDGLSGVLRDKKTYDMDGELIEGDTLEDIIRNNRESLNDCREALWKAAEKADWYDNVTVVLCEIRSGANTYVPDKKEDNLIQKSNAQQGFVNKTLKGFNFHISTKGLFFSVIGLILVICMTFWAAWEFSTKLQHDDSRQTEKNDSVAEDKTLGVPQQNNDLGFVNAQTGLKLKIAEIQKDLSLPNNDPIVNELNNLIEEAKDTISLSAVGKKVSLLKYKVKYLKRIDIERANNASNKAILSSLKNLYDKIVSANKIEGEKWEKEIVKIIETKSNNVKSNTNDNPTEDNDITEILHKDETKIHEAKIQKGDTYEGLISFLERKRYKGYYVSIIKDKETGKTLFNTESPEEKKDIDNAIGRNVEITLKKK